MENTENTPQLKNSEMIELDAKKQQQARQYARIKRRLMIFETIFDLTYILVWLFKGWSSTLQIFLQDFFPAQWLLIPIYVFFFSLPLGILSLPLTYYSGYFLPRKFGLSTQSIKDWIMDGVKAGLVGGILGLVVLEGLYLFLKAAPDTWWLWMAVFMFVFRILLSSLAPAMIFPIFYKFSPLGEDHQDLQERLLLLGERTGTPLEGIYKFNLSHQTTAANAALIGLGKSKRIILGDTLIDEFSIDEIETVVAHELGHQVHQDMLTGIVVGSLITFVSFYYTSIFLDFGVRYFSLQGIAQLAAFPLLVLGIGIIGFVFMPLENLFSRWRETKADIYSLETTKKAAQFISAFNRLANQNLAEIDPQPWEVFLFHSHPPIKQRIRMAQTFIENIN
ncbi:MAG: M48 family metallopeptidase [Anaerolineales bacterium]|nr:M48 family metallopeptidase [Anaerolineales bacterium]